MKIDKILKDLNPIEHSIREAIISAYNLGKADRDKEIAAHNVFFSNKPIEDIVLAARADERINTVQFIIDEFNRRTVCLGRAAAKTYVIDTLTEILKELKGTKNGNS